MICSGTMQTHGFPLFLLQKLILSLQTITKLVPICSKFGLKLPQDAAQLIPIIPKLIDAAPKLSPAVLSCLKLLSHSYKSLSSRFRANLGLFQAGLELPDVAPRLAFDSMNINLMRFQTYQLKFV